MKKVKTIERGWAGHFICADMCRYRRNTLIEKGDKKIIVSTVGNYDLTRTCTPGLIGHNRYYETMAFEAKRNGKYWDADVTKEISFNSDWAISKITDDSDNLADKMHETVVRELSQ